MDGVEEQQQEDRLGGGRWVCEVVEIFLVQHQITTRLREVAVPAVVSSTEPGSTQGVYLRRRILKACMYRDKKLRQCNIDLILSAPNACLLLTLLNGIVLYCTSDETENS